MIRAGMTPRILVWAVALASANAASPLSGIWRGTYHTQPNKLLPDGAYPENVSKFEISLKEDAGRVTGEFRKLGPVPDRTLRIENGKMFGTRACFDIILDEEDSRWCVEARRDRLIGSWARGPEGGPLLDGAGTGARLFGITGSRQPRKTSR